MLNNILEQTVKKQCELCEKCTKLSAHEFLCDGTRPFIDEEATKYYGRSVIRYDVCDKKKPYLLNQHLYDNCLSAGIPDKYVRKYIEEAIESEDWLLKDNSVVDPSTRETIFEAGVDLIKRGRKFVHLFVPAMVSRGYNWPSVIRYMDYDLVVFDRIEIAMLKDFEQEYVLELISQREYLDKPTWFVVESESLKASTSKVSKVIYEHYI